MKSRLVLKKNFVFFYPDPRIINSVYYDESVIRSQSHSYYPFPKDYPLNPRIKFNCSEEAKTQSYRQVGWNKTGHDLDCGHCRDEIESDIRR